MAKVLVVITEHARIGADGVIVCGTVDERGYRCTVPLATWKAAASPEAQQLCAAEALAAEDRKARAGLIDIRGTLKVDA